MPCSVSTLQRAGAMVAAASGLLLGAAALAAQAQTPAAPRYRIVDAHVLYLGNPPLASGISAINNHGDLGAYVIDDLSDVDIGYVVRDGRRTPGLAGAVYGLNERGDAVTSFYDERENTWSGYLWAGGRSREIPKLSPADTQLFAYGLNDAGQVVGSSGNQAFILDERGSRRLLGADVADASDAFAINNAGVVVGRVRLPGTGADAFRPFRLQDGRLTLLSRGPGSAGLINDAGQIAGTLRNGLTQRPFLFTDGRLQTFGPEGISAFVTGLNNAGAVVGNYQAPGDVFSRPFLYQDGVMRDIDDLLRPADARRWTFGGVGDINDAGVIVGSAYTEDRAFPHAVVAVPVPEPAQALLLAAGLGVVAAAARRRRADAAQGTKEGPCPCPCAA